MFLAAASRLLRGKSQHSFFVRPDTLLGWLRQLVRRPVDVRWTACGVRKPVRVGEPVNLQAKPSLRTPQEVKDTKTGQTRAVRLLTPLSADLAEWRLYCGRPPEDALVFPTRKGERWTDSHWRNWRKRVFAPAAAVAELSAFRPYDLRHSFVSLLIAEGRSVVEIAKQAGHSTTMALTTYGHVIEELEAAEKRPAEELIRAARDELVPLMFPQVPKPRRPKKRKSLENPESPLTDSNRRPPPYHGRNRWQRSWLGGAVFRPLHLPPFAAGCARSAPLTLHPRALRVLRLGFSRAFPVSVLRTRTLILSG